MPKYQKGTSTVELALILPLFFLFLDGFIEIGTLLFDKALITHASREAVHAGSLISKPKLDVGGIQSVASDLCQTFLITYSSDKNYQVVVNQSPDGSYQSPLSVTVTFTYSSFLFSGVLASLNTPVVLASTSYGFNE